MRCMNDRRSREASKGGCSVTLISQMARGSGQAGWLFVQRHIRQHMPTRPGIIIPALLFASWADKGRALVVMGGIMSDRVAPCQNGHEAAERA
jgi:hypothetical protein